jgi:hypothetical protein
MGRAGKILESLGLDVLDVKPVGRGVCFCSFCGAALRYPTDKTVGSDLAKGLPPRCEACVEAGE